jgi:hypothetical protein
MKTVLTGDGEVEKGKVKRAEGAKRERGSEVR